MTDTLAKRIHDLAVLDRVRRVFGSNTHNYVGTKIASADLLLVRIRLGKDERGVQT